MERATTEGVCGKWERNNTFLLYLVPAETPLSCLLSSLYFISSIICYCLSKKRKTTESTLRAHSSSSVLFELSCFFLLSNPIFILLLLQTHPSSLKVYLSLMPHKTLIYEQLEVNYIFGGSSSLFQLVQRRHSRHQSKLCKVHSVYSGALFINWHTKHHSCNMVPLF